MKKVIYNQNKINELGQTLSNKADEIYRNLNKIDELLELLPESFYDINSKKKCDEIRNNQIIILKDYCGRLLNMQKFLNKMSDAYNELDEIKVGE